MQLGGGYSVRLWSSAAPDRGALARSQHAGAATAARRPAPAMVGRPIRFRLVGKARLPRRPARRAPAHCAVLAEVGSHAGSARAGGAALRRAGQPTPGQRELRRRPADGGRPRPRRLAGRAGHRERLPAQLRHRPQLLGHLPVHRRQPAPHRLRPAPDAGRAAAGPAADRDLPGAVPTACRPVTQPADQRQHAHGPAHLGRQRRQLPAACRSAAATLASNPSDGQRRGPGARPAPRGPAG